MTRVLSKVLQKPQKVRVEAATANSICWRPYFCTAVAAGGGDGQEHPLLSGLAEPSSPLSTIII